MSYVVEKLMELADDKYADFSAKLTPGIDRSLFIGVRVPDARKLAREIYRAGDYDAFLNELPHKYFDENMLHGLIISEIRDYDECITRIDEFLPYVDNWAVCDIMSPKCFRKNLNVLIDKIRNWTGDEWTYTSRFGMEMLMSHYLDEEFRPEYLEIPAAVHSEEYYLMMMQAWFYATALAKQWTATIGYLTEHRLSVWVHNKTIQKARESYRITEEQKEYLKGLKIK